MAFTGGRERVHECCRPKVTMEEALHIHGTSNEGIVRENAATVVE